MSKDDSGEQVKVQDPTGLLIVRDDVRSKVNLSAADTLAFSFFIHASMDKFAQPVDYLLLSSPPPCLCEELFPGS